MVRLMVDRARGWGLAVAGVLALLTVAAAAAQAPTPPAAPRPGEHNTVLPLFRAPFAGQYPVSNVFDHDLPYWGRDSNGYQLAWWGEAIAAPIDGHDGYDWRLPEGTPVLAAAEGSVVFAGETAPAPCPLLGEIVSALVVTLEHRLPTAKGELRVRSRYVHLSAVDVAAGQFVLPGQPLGRSGNTGCSTRPHLHFEMLRQRSDGGNWVKFDPYGWDGPAPDPWAHDPAGAASLWLWEAGSAPLLYRLEERSLNPSQNDNAMVGITALRWLGWRDVDHPENEYVEVAADPRFAPAGGVSLGGWHLQNNAGDAYEFPADFRLASGGSVRVYSGAGSDDAESLYWGRASGVWDNRGDCAHLARPDGRNLYRFRYGNVSC